MVPDRTMNRAVSAVGGGVAGTAVLSLLLLLLEVETRSVLEIFHAIARFAGVPGQLSVGFVVFVLAGVLAWPLVFLGIEHYIPLSDTAERGMAFAAVLWVAFVVVGRGTLTGTHLLVFAGGSLLAHLTYGFTLGVVYDRLREGSV